ncbi:MAG: hypothetical protein E6I76_20680 [Chloroflexi bacterium]|nr:MAG: hypothetical protein E6I76_20680 [Chloroflexota bacterium]
MCASCGCGEPHIRHLSGDIVLGDLILAARNHGLDLDQVIQNIAGIRGALPNQPFEAAASPQATGWADRSPQVPPPPGRRR